MLPKASKSHPRLLPDIVIRYYWWLVVQFSDNAGTVNSELVLHWVAKLGLTSKLSLVDLKTAGSNTVDYNSLPGS